MSGDLPPTDHVARVLLKRGARDQAIALLRAAIQRDSGEKACAALLRAVEARPNASVYGPELLIGMDLVEGYIRSGMFVEALAVLEGAGLARDPASEARAQMLRELLAPIPEDADPQLREVDRQVRTGGASVALSMLDSRRGMLPPWAQERHALLQQMLIDTAQPAPMTGSATAEDATPLGRALEGAFAGRDMHAILAAARAHAAAHPADGDAAAAIPALERLVDAMAAASAEMSSTVLRTQPMTGHHVALFQLRMANLDVAERMFRKLVVDEPLDEVARQRLEDIQTVRAALTRDEPSREASDLPLTSPSTAPMAGPIDPLMATMSVSEDDLAAAGGDSQPALSAVVLVPADATAPVEPSVLEKAVEATKHAHLPPRPGDEARPPSSPELLNKTSRPSWASSDYRPATPRDWEDESSTDVGHPERHAELLLKQGLAEHAVRIYQSLVERFPNEGAYVLRLREIHGILERQRAARAASDVPPEPSPRTSVPSSGPIWIGEPAENAAAVQSGSELAGPGKSGVVVSSSPPPRDAEESPAKPDAPRRVSGLGPTPAVGVSRSSWDDDSTTVEPVSNVSLHMMEPDDLPPASEATGEDARSSEGAPPPLPKRGPSSAPSASESNAVVQVRRIIAVH